MIACHLAPQTAWQDKVRHGKTGASAWHLGPVEMDGSYMGGKKQCRRAGGAGGMTPVAFMAERSSTGGLPGRAGCGRRRSRAAARSVVPANTIMTDARLSCRVIGYVNEPPVQKTPRDVSSLVPWVDMVVSNSKRWMLHVFMASALSVFGPISMSFAAASTVCRREPIPFAPSQIITSALSNQ